MSISVVGPSPTNRSQRCHSEVMLVSGTGSSRAHTIVLFNVSAYRNSVWHSWEASQCFDSRQITASQRALACCSACFQRAPGRMPVCGSRSKIDLLGQTRLLLDQPRLDRDRLTAIPAGMTQKHPRHNSPPQRDPSGAMGSPGQASM